MTKRDTLRPDAHVQLMRAIMEEFVPRFVPDSVLVHTDRAGENRGHLDAPLLARLGVKVTSRGMMPNLVLHQISENRLFLIESVASHGPIEQERHSELAQTFGGSTAELVYVNAFPTQAVLRGFVEAIAWGTVVWVAETPSHLIHFDGGRLLGPYKRAGPVVAGAN